MNPSEFEFNAGDGTIDTRTEIFETLVQSMEHMTPSEIATQMGGDTSRENVHHHLTWLVSAGLVINDGGAYYVQPLFIDPGFRDNINTALAKLAPEAVELMYADPEWSDRQQAQAVSNCIQTAVAMSILSPGLSADDTR